MPRKAFLADLHEAIEALAHVDAPSGSAAQYVTALHCGEDDGSFTFSFGPLDSTEQTITISVLIPELSEYPKNHQTFLSVESGPPHIADNIQDLCYSLNGAPVLTILSLASRCLTNALPKLRRAAGAPSASDEMISGDDSDQGQNDEALESGSEERNKDDDTLSEEDDDGVDDWMDESTAIFTEDPEIDFGGNWPRPRQDDLSSFKFPAAEREARLQSDLQAAKEAGFRAGHLGKLKDGGPAFLSISCRIARLDLTEEALDAWNLHNNWYLVFLIQYKFGYVNLSEMLQSKTHHSHEVKMLVGTCTHYKPTLEEANCAFAKASSPNFIKEGTDAASKGKSRTGCREFQDIFIGAPLRDLLNKRLLDILGYRLNMHFGWRGAEEYWDDYHGLADHTAYPEDKYYAPDPPRRMVSPLVLGDHVSELQQAVICGNHVPDASFPLAGMQFVLRRVVRCTEFCMNCHSKVTTDFEALKPYVCSKELCLYQYMTYGFGPSIEHEIKTHPRVVDLLISFCYQGAAWGRLRDFPTGLHFTVPAIEDVRIDCPVRPDQNFQQHNFQIIQQQFLQQNNISVLDPNTAAPEISQRIQYIAEYNPQRCELHFTDFSQGSAPGMRIGCPVKVGDWIIINTGNATQPRIHCRVMDCSYFPIINLGSPVFCRKIQEAERGDPSKELTRNAKVTFTIYNQEFDKLNDPRDKCAVIMVILSTLPGVFEMKNYLSTSPHLSDDVNSLQNWRDRVSPAAYSVLRWIIASNRSCIVEVDNEQKIRGMPGWLQFKFAMGSPEKEQVFSSMQTTQTLGFNINYPTLFAWHGSEIGNWHGIIREGLNFNEVRNGRAYGNGVYHSLDFTLAVVYSRGLSVGYTAQNNLQAYMGWPHSELRITSAVSLNEIVNAPGQFVSRTPHVVVDKLAWIQTRYLFVQSNVVDERGLLGSGIPVVSAPKSNDLDLVRVNSEFQQDPLFTAKGLHGWLSIPTSALRRTASSALRHGNRKARLGEDTEVLNADGDASEASDNEDIELIWNDSKAKSEKQMTDFVPGTLDHSLINKSAEPTYAGPQATKSLQRELISMVKLQNSVPPHELGWYIDPDHIGNVYQWILELHSFEMNLPLTMDLKQKGLTSVVLEMRFGSDFPMTPPFVRVIRPRFLPFQMGGGGHVTAGGAMCMELLASNGWSPATSMESLLLQVRLALSSTEPRPARLESGPVKDYGIAEAFTFFERAIQMHNWTLPSSLRVIQHEAQLQASSLGIRDAAIHSFYSAGLSSSRSTGN